MSDAWLSKLSDPDPWKAPDPLPGPIQTDRAIVRLYQRGDGPRLLEAIDADRPALMPWMIWATTDQQTETDAVYYVEKSRRGVEKPGATDFPMGIFDRTSGAQLGGTGFHRIRTDYREAEVGYWIRGDRHGRGVCTEAVGAVISAGLRSADDGGWGFRRIVIFCAGQNQGSRRVCEKLGLRLESRCKLERYMGAVEGHIAAGYHDTYGFAVLRDEWEFAHDRAKPDIGWP